MFNPSKSDTCIYILPWCMSFCRENMLLLLFGSSMYDACQKNYKCITTMENVYLHVYNSLRIKNANTSPANVYVMSWIHMILHLTMVLLCRYNILPQLASMMPVKAIIMFTIDNVLTVPVQLEAYVMVKG